MRTHLATCACGQLRLHCVGDPVRVGVCHCRACQRRTGSAFGVQARFHRTQIRSLEGAVSVFVRTGDSGGTVTFRFCPACGSTLCWEVDGLPEFCMVAVGAFADATFPAPAVSVYADRQHPWVTLSRGIEHLD